MKNDIQVTKLMLVGAFFLCPRLVRAEEVNKNMPLEQRVEALEKQVKEQQEHSMGTLLGQNKISLLLQLQAIHNESPTAIDTFKGRRAEIKLYGNILPKKVSYVLNIDPFLTGNITKDAFITLSYIHYADIQFGQYKFPQSLEGRWSSGDLDFIERSIVSRTFGDKRDFGAQLSGSKIPVGAAKGEYAFGFFNGAGQNVAENNNHKDFAGRLGAEWYGVFVGGNAYIGKEPSGDRDRYGGELRYVNGKWKVQVEFLGGKTEKAGSAPTGQRGYYILTNYVWKSLRPGIRWESWDPDENVDDNRQDALTMGLDLLLTPDRKNKISLNYTANFEQANQINNDVWALQMQVGY